MSRLDDGININIAKSGSSKTLHYFSILGGPFVYTQKYILTFSLSSNEEKFGRLGDGINVKIAELASSKDPRYFFQSWKASLNKLIHLYIEINRKFDKNRQTKHKSQDTNMSKY